MILSNNPDGDRRAYLRDTLIGYAIGIALAVAVALIAHTIAG